MPSASSGAIASGSLVYGISWIYGITGSLDMSAVGPRLAAADPGVVGALGGISLAVGGIGILTHQLWLLYLGYGVIGGCGLGLGYVSPVSTLIRWFPDRRGMATGMAIMGFGGGAMIGAPLFIFLLKKTRR